MGMSEHMNYATESRNWRHRFSIKKWKEEKKRKKIHRLERQTHSVIIMFLRRQMQISPAAAAASHLWQAVLSWFVAATWTSAPFFKEAARRGEGRGVRWASRAWRGGQSSRAASPRTPLSVASSTAAAAAAVSSDWSSTLLHFTCDRGGVLQLQGSHAHTCWPSLPLDLSSIIRHWGGSSCQRCDETRDGREQTFGLLVITEREKKKTNREGAQLPFPTFGGS